MKSYRPFGADHMRRLVGRGTIAFFAIALGFALAAAPAVASSNRGADPVLAIVGGQRITQSEVDARVIDEISASQRYDLRKRALDSMVDKYVVDAAAKKAHLTPSEYLDRAIHPTGSQVTAAEARKYYDGHKAGLDAQTGGKPFEQIKPALVAAMQRHADDERREALLAKLRTDYHVKMMFEAPREQVSIAGNPWTGGKDAPVTIVEFSDFQCPFCRAAEPTIKQMREKYGDRVKLVYLDFPLEMHPHALDAAIAGRCAGEQNKFWQFHDAMFADQKKLDPAALKQTAGKLGLDTKKFDACFDGKQVVPGIRADQAEGERLGVNGTPTFFINGIQMVGVKSPQAMSVVIDKELARAGGAEKAAAANPAKRPVQAAAQ